MGNGIGEDLAPSKRPLRAQRSVRLFATRLLAIGALAEALSAFWYIRNYAEYGDPFALGIVLQVWGQRSIAERGLARLAMDARFAFANFWGRFGYGQVSMPAWFYLVLLVLSLAAAAACLLRVLRLGARGLRRFLAGPWPILGLTSLGFAAAMLHYLVRNPTGGNGRYLYPAMPALAALLVAGLSVWLDRLRRPSRGYAGLSLLMAGLATYWLLFLYRTYAPPALFSVTVER